MQKTISLEDIRNSAEKFGRDSVLEYDTKNISDLRTKNPQCKYDVTYFPLMLKLTNGKKVPVKIKFNEQMISSAVKNPSGDIDDIPKNLNVSFQQLSQEAVEGGDYIPKKKDNAEDQSKEDDRVSNNIQRYLANNTEWVDVLDILATRCY